MTSGFGSDGDRPERIKRRHQAGLPVPRERDVHRHIAFDGSYGQSKKSGIVATIANPLRRTRPIPERARLALPSGREI
jgi:hypothetical protein